MTSGYPTTTTVLSPSTLGGFGGTISFLVPANTPPAVINTNEPTVGTTAEKTIGAISTFFSYTTITGKSTTSTSRATIRYSYSTFPSSATVLDCSATALPPSPPGFNGPIFVPDGYYGCAVDNTELNAALMIECCNGARRVLYNNNYQIYCDAIGQSAYQLTRCLLAQNKLSNITQPDIQNEVVCHSERDSDALSASGVLSSSPTPSYATVAGSCPLPPPPLRSLLLTLGTLTALSTGSTTTTLPTVSTAAAAAGPMPFGTNGSEFGTAIGFLRMIASLLMTGVVAYVYRSF